MTESERRLSVLLVDDDPDDHLIIRGMLDEVRTTRYLVETATSSEAALARMAQGGFDAYLVDYRLGPSSGLDLFRELVSRGDSTPFILLTGQGDWRTDLEAMESGVADYLVKSQISSPLLERSIRYAINRVHLHAQIVQQDRLASIGLLASSLAHEIGTPLGVIRGRAEYLALKETNPLVQENTRIIVTQIDRVAQLIRSLLTLARGEEKAQTDNVAVHPVVAEVSNLLGHELRRNQIRFENEIPQDLCVLASAGPLHQVLLNLLVNAIHAIQSAREGGRSAEDHFIRVTCKSPQSARVQILIEDSGCGISEANMRRLFTPFFTTKDVGKGTGLGLATSFRIVEGWGGSIHAHSDVGKGTTFTLDLHSTQSQDS